MSTSFSQDLLNNTVSAKDQLESDQYVSFERVEAPVKKVLFIGNSITRHGVADYIGWHNDWGMAASDISKDYVHVAAATLRQAFGPISVCIAQCATWEWQYWSTEVLEQYYARARDFAADIIVVRLGENVDRGKLAEHDLAAGFADMVKFFAVNPAAQIVVTDLFWRSEAIDEPIARACEANGWPLVEIGDLGAMDEMKALGLFEHEGVALHPGDKGMAAIAARITDHIVNN